MEALNEFTHGLLSLFHSLLPSCMSVVLVLNFQKAFWKCFLYSTQRLTMIYIYIL